MRLLSGVLLFLCCSLHAVAAVTGQVIDEDGKPLRGARVRAFAIETWNAFLDRAVSEKPAPAALASTETADDGAFRIDAKPPVFVLLADAPGHAYAQMDVAGGDDVTIVLRAAPVRRGKVTAAGRGVANATLIADRLVVTQTGEDGAYELPDPSLWANRIYVVHRDYAILDHNPRTAPLDIELQAGRTIRGRVVAAGDKPVANAVVRLNGFPLARSGEDGTFTIAHASRDARAISASTAERIGSAEATAESVTIRTAHGARLTGVVRSTKDETPVAGARITVSATPTSARFETISDAKGNFTIDGIEPALHRIALTHPAFLYSGSELQLTEGAREQRALASTPLPRLRGVVVDESRKPVAAARVRVTNSPSSAMTSPAGTFTVRVPIRGRTTSIEVSKRSYASASWGPVTLEPGEVRSDARIVLSRGIPFEFRLADAEGVAIAGEPLLLLRRADPEERFSSVPIRCEQGAELDDCRTDAKGRVVYTIAEGKYDIRAGGIETVLHERSGQMLNAEASPMTITLARGAPVEGRVVWSDGTAVDVPVTVSSTGRPPLTSRTTDGVFAMRNAPAGKLLLFARTDGPSVLQSEALEVTAPANGVVLKLERPGRIEGRVVERATEKAVTDFQVMTEMREQRWFNNRPKSFHADDGAFVLEGVAPGTVDVIVTAPGFVRATIGDVAVESAKTATVTVALDRGGSVAGRITAAGRPVADAVVVVEDKGQGVRWFGRQNNQTRADGNGEYRLDGIPPGAQRIHVQREGYVAKMVEVNVTAGAEARADAELDRGLELRGRVVDAEGRPLANADVMFRNATTLIGGMPLQRTTDASGEFRFSGLTSATHTISARKTGFAEEAMDVNPSTTPEITIALRRGATITGRILGVPEAELPFIDVHVSNTPTRVQPDATGAFAVNGVGDGEVLVTAIQQRPRVRQVRARVRVTNGAAPPVDLDFSGGILVSGRVTREGKPLTSGRIAFMPTGPAAGTWAHAQIERDGSYEVSFSGPGEYQIRVNDSPAAGKVSVRETMRHDIDLRGATITGRVVDALTREPISDAEVMLVPDAREGPFGVIEDRSDATGKFLLPLVGEGRWLISAQKDEYAPEVREVFVQNERAPEVEIALLRGQTAMLRVLAPDGVPVEASLSVSDESGRHIYQGRLPRDASGVQRLSLKPGRYTVNAFVPAYKPAKAALVVPGPLVEIRLETR